MIHLYFLVLPDALLLDVVGPAEVFQYANRINQKTGGEALYQLHFIGPTLDVNNSLGLPIQLNPLPDTIEKGAWLIIPGLVGDDIPLTTPAINTACGWINQQVFNRYISICAGSLVLAKTGLLKGKNCTTHHIHLDDLKKWVAPHQVLENRLFVVDGNIYTSAGVTAGIDLALYLIQENNQASLASDIAQYMVLFSRRGSQDPSFSPWLEHRNHLHQKVHLVQNAIQCEPEKNWSLNELAKIAHCSTRHLARLFKNEAQVTTKEYTYKLRLNLALQLLQTSDLPIEIISSRCGFDDARQFRRLWARYHQQSPSVFRLQHKQ